LTIIFLSSYTLTYFSHVFDSHVLAVDKT